MATVPAAVLPIEDIVKIIVNLSPRSAVRNAFNLAMIVGTSNAISTEDRVMVYSSTDSMLADGFTDDMPEYKVAARYFNQSSGPDKLAICRWDDQEESLLQAVRDARSKNRDWYVCIPMGATDEQILLMAEYIESCTPVALQAYTVPYARLSLLETLKKMNYRRTFGMVSETDNAVAAIMGWAMGANTGLRDSAYTLAYKVLVGIEVDDYNENEVAKIQAVNGNYYVNRGAQYDGFEGNVMADGVWFDEIINLDMLVNDLQLSIMDLLHTRKKVPQTEGGVNMIKNVMRDPLDKMVRIGFVAGGIWKGPDMLNLQYGDAIEDGYLIQSEPVAEQSQADRDQRIAPPIYVALKLAGAIHHVVVQVDVNR